MSKNIDRNFFYQLPSGVSVHPCRLIVRDGTLMWKHALLADNCFTSLPQTHAHEAHIVKTAHRLEELNAWISKGLEPWQCLRPILWYDPSTDNHTEGIRVSFKHSLFDDDQVYDTLVQHLQVQESLIQHKDKLTFIRC